MTGFKTAILFFQFLIFPVYIENIYIFLFTKWESVILIVTSTAEWKKKLICNSLLF